MTIMLTEINNYCFSNAHHPAKKYCEWWYFTFFFGEKNVVSGIFKIENKLPEVWIFVKEVGRKAVYIRKTFSHKNFFASTEECDVRIGDNFFRERDGVCKVKINFPEIKLEASFKKTCCWNDNLIERQLGKAEKIFWLVPCVKGRFSGRLKFGDKTETISGLAFHDHVWHNINAIRMFKNFKEWFWGISYSAKETHLYASVDMGKRGRFKFIFSSDGKSQSKMVDYEAAGQVSKEAFINVDPVCWNKMAAKLKTAEKDPVNQWGNSVLIKFFTNKVLGFSQYHCFSKEGGRPENWDYLEILQRRARFLR